MYLARRGALTDYITTARAAYNAYRYYKPYLDRARNMRRGMLRGTVARQTYNIERPRWIRRYRKRARGTKRRRTTPRKRRVRKKLMRFGTISKRLVKRAVLYENANSTINERNFYTRSLTNIVGGSDDIDKRRYNRIRLHGIRYEGVRWSQTTRPLYFCWAIIHPRSSTTIDQDKFFRSDAGTVRYRGFATANNTSEDYYFGAINPDLYDTLYRGRVILNQDGAGTATNPYTGGKSHQVFKHYFPINRPVTYDSDVLTSAEDKIYFVYWCSEMGHGKSHTPIINVMRHSYRLTVFWTDIQK